MIDFGVWSAAEAREYCEQYSLAVPIRAEWLSSEVEASGGDPAWCRDAGGLDPLWQWFAGRLRSEGPTGVRRRVELPAGDPQPGARPPWHSPDQPNPYLADDALWLIDALGCHLGVLAALCHPEAEWKVDRPSNRKDINFNRTRLFGVPGGPSDPAQMVYGATIRTVIHDQPWKPGELSRLYHYLVDPLD